jgi:hypothetical protein
MSISTMGKTRTTYWQNLKVNHNIYTVGRKISMVTVLVLGILKLYFNCTIYEKDVKVQFSNDSWP